MKKFWFKAKRYGLGWYPASLAGWLVLFFYVAANVSLFILVDQHSHSDSDTLIRFAPRFLVFTALLYVVCYFTGEKLSWRWGEDGEIVLEKVLRAGGIAVMPTDTTYGIVGSALNVSTVNEIYRLRRRDLDKPFIVLIAQKADLRKFGARLSPAQTRILNHVWPGQVSVILSCPSERFSYLHRGKKTIAFRLPQKPGLRRLLAEIGPLVAPSANPQGHPIAKNISEARAYFGHNVDFYQDGGEIDNKPSRLIDITDGTEKVVRL